jgi:streptomycin 6-kinase
MTSGSEQADEDEEEIGEHLADVRDGCGCAEIWEHLSEERDES